METRYMVRKISIHDNDKVAGDEIEAVDVCRPESARKFAETTTARVK